MSRKTVVDAGIFVFVILAVTVYLFYEKLTLAFVFLVLAALVGWFRRDLYRYLPI